MPVIELSQEAMDELARAATQETGLHRRRAQAILMLAQGESIDHIAVQVGLTQRQILYWLRRYQRYGLDIFPNADETEPVADKQSGYSRPTMPILEKPGVEADDPMSEAGRKVLAYHFAALLNREGAVREQSDP